MLRQNETLDELISVAVNDCFNVAVLILIAEQVGAHLSLSASVATK